MAKKGRARRAPEPAPAAPRESADDTALRSLQSAERARLEIDSWEPSLLRELLRAQNKLPNGRR